MSPRILDQANRSGIVAVDEGWTWLRVAKNLAVPFLRTTNSLVVYYR
jgi:hypothetical protein